VFERHLTTGSLLLLAHHADDQVETVLYRLLRGSGPRGLSGIPANRQVGRGELLRPLLSFTRSELQAYAEQKKLGWVDDESNADTDFDRNFIRHRLLPPLRERWPDYAARVAHSAALCRDNDELAAMLAAQDLIAVYEREERLGWSISVEAMLHLEELRRANLLRHWPEHHQIAPPAHRAVETALTELLPAREDAEPVVSWGGVQLRRYQRRLYLLPRKMEEKRDLPESTLWALPGTLSLADGSFLGATREQGRGLWVPEGETLEIRYRQGGERCKPFGRSGSNTLKRLFQEYSVEPWLRDQVPLLYLHDQLVAVADL
jgi:tRNA(Ile)-lysidine synthase